MLKIEHLKKSYQNLVLTIAGLISANNTFSQRRHRERYDGPIPELGMTFEYFLYAIGLFVIAGIIIKASSYLKNESTLSNVLLVFAGLLVLGGFICFIPALIWLETIGNIVIGIVVGAVILIVVISLLVTWIKGKF